MITLNNEDCLETIKRIEDNTIDLCLTDLPYGILKSNKKEANFNNENRNFCDWDEEINYNEVLPHLKRVMKKDGNVLLFAKSPFTFRLYEQMTKHGFTFRYNWIWKKNKCPNFAAMKYRPGSIYEEVMVFSPTPKNGKYFAYADFNGEVKTICNFYDYEKRIPITSEEVFDNYLIPFIFENDIKKDVRISCAGNYAKSNTCKGGIKLKEILNKDVGIVCSGDTITSNASKCYIRLNKILNKDIVIYPCTQREGTLSNNVSVPIIHLDKILNEEVNNENIENSKVKSNDTQLNKIFKEKYRDQFEIDFENKILYRTVKSYKNFPTSIIDIKYSNGCNKKYKKHPTTKPVEVLEFLLHHYTEENDLVLDMTAGSGSTAVACKKMNRNFVGSEISKVWFDVAQQRINDI